MMPSVLLIPTTEIPFHFLHFPITQCEALLTHVLTHPCLSQALANTAVFWDDPTITQLILLYQSHIIVCLISSCLIVPLIPVEISEALNAGLSAACSTIFVLLVDR